MLHPLQRVLDPWSHLTERSGFVGATGGHFASAVSIERLRRLNLPLAHRLHSVSFLQPRAAGVQIRCRSGQPGRRGRSGKVQRVIAPLP